MAQSIPDRTIINQIAFGYLDAYYSTEKLPPLPTANGNVTKEAINEDVIKSTAAKNGSVKKRAVKNQNAQH